MDVTVWMGEKLVESWALKGRSKWAILNFMRLIISSVSQGSSLESTRSNTFMSNLTKTEFISSSFVLQNGNHN